ncbi:MAG: NfeD family protein [Methanobrevibacter sp.]|nr:NfeD family protein [Methanobrevibacter sp.]
MFEIPLSFWIILFAGCLFLEIVTTGFYLMSVGIGAAIAAVANYIGFDPTAQLIIFVVVTIICLLASRPFANILTRGSPDKKAATDRFIGKEGVVIEAIDHDNAGMIKISGEEWRAISTEIISVGESVIVEKVKGVKLKVRKK